MSQFIDKLLRNAHTHTLLGETAQAEEIYKHILSRFPKNKKAIEEYAKIQNPPKVELENLIRPIYLQSISLNYFRGWPR